MESDKNRNTNKEAEEAVNYVYEELKLLLFNKKHIPIETQKICEAQTKKLKKR